MITFIEHIAIVAVIVVVPLYRSIYSKKIIRRALLEAFPMRAEEAYLLACRAGGWPPERSTLRSLAEASLTLDLRLCSPQQLSAVCGTLKEKPSGVEQSLGKEANDGNNKYNSI